MSVVCVFGGRCVCVVGECVCMVCACGVFVFVVCVSGWVCVWCGVCMCGECLCVVCVRVV